MQRLTSVLVVHHNDTPAKQATFTLCDEHLVVLRRATWAGIDELVGFSAVMECEACALIDGRAAEGRTTSTDAEPRHPHLQPLPTQV
jgi:hypothetical protein